MKAGQTILYLIYLASVIDAKNNRACLLSVLIGGFGRDVKKLTCFVMLTKACSLKNATMEQRSAKGAKLASKHLKSRAGTGSEISPVT